MIEPLSEAKNLPLVSVVISVYNCEATVEAALDSIRAQTYPNWELVVCDDCSTDGTPAALKKMAERVGRARFILLSNSSNRKLPYSLNRCLKAASGELIARMDGDDISEPNRLARQVAFLSENPDVDLVGTAMRRFNESGLGDVIHPASPEPDRWTLGRSSKAPFFHATIMARRTVFDRVGNYTVASRTVRVEDVDLWYKFFKAGLIGRNLPEPLYRVREDEAAIRRRTPKSRVAGFVTSVIGSWNLGYPPSAYAKAIVDLSKIFVPYRVFDWHRQRSRAHSAPEGGTWGSETL